MTVRRIVTGLLVAGFVAVVVHASAANQCPASALGACARVHFQLMRVPVTLVAQPMRAVTDRG